LKNIDFKEAGAIPWIWNVGIVEEWSDGVVVFWYMKRKA
jgi:hypothetical protein